MADNSSVNETDAEKQCLVCNDMSSGRHYGAFTCEGCKGFFRRIICYNNQNLYSCIGPEVKNKCEITNDSSRRKCCKSCRFQKCLRIGMKPELCIKIERRHQMINYIDSNQSNDEELESGQMLMDLKHEIEDSFNNYMNFIEFDAIVSNHSFETNYYLFLNRLRLSLESNVRKFMSFITILRQLNVDIQKELMYSALNEILVLKICSDIDRCGQLIRQNNVYFDNKETDDVFRCLLEQLNDVLNGEQSIIIIPALYVLTFFNCIRINPNERNYIQKSKLKVLKAFNLDDEMKSAKMSQILQQLAQTSALLKKSRVFYFHD